MKDKNEEPVENNPPAGNQPPSGNGGSASPDGDGSQPQPPMLALSMEEYDALQKDLEQTRAKASEYFEGWQRERADFLNYKKRIDRDNAQVYQNALVTVLKKYLVVMDDLDRALKTAPSKGEGSHWAKGVELIRRKLCGLIEAEGIKQMDFAGNEMFDPMRHEAITHEDSPDHQSGQIIEVVQPGYLLGDRVIRPALVRVAR
jgi:molecular chaperone GrpE